MTEENDSRRAPRGVFVALATTLNDDSTVDYPSLSKLLNHVVAGGVDGICPVGSTGEGPLLQRRDRIEITQFVKSKVSDGMDVIPATVSVTPADALTDLHSYHEVGASSALVPPPFYYPMEAGAIKEFFTTLADASPLPIVLYNIPQMTKVSIPPALVGELGAHENIIGIKDSSRDFEYFSSVCDQVAMRELDNFSVLTGTDTMLSSCNLVGGSGTIAASVNLVPKLVVDLQKATLDKDYDQAKKYQVQLLRIVQACRVPGFPAGWKAALSLLGLCSMNVALPARIADEAQVEKLRGALVDLGVI
ncbi:MAG: dihydrodipicolinate synthase family protein [Actinomycetota bacterium]|nr:dihydrodipicolinate synthase family protein [Actinomycetota bacterium]